MIIQEFYGKTIQQKNWTEWYFEDEYQHCPLCMVLAMTGAGKSTLLNALAGQQFLPYSNLSCTARETALLHWYGKKEAEAVFRCADRTWTVHDKIEQEIKHFNDMEDPGGVLIRHGMEGFKSCKIPFLIQDIPGLGDAGNPARTERAKLLLSKMERGLVIYVTKATLVGTDGEQRCLMLLKEKLAQTPSLHWMVVLNGADQCSQSELEQAIRREHSFMEDCGLPKKKIYPISALAALRFRQRLAGLPMDTGARRQYLQMQETYYWAFYESDDEAEDESHHCTRQDILQFLSKTGIISLEQTICSYVDKMADDLLDSLIHKEK